MKNVYESYFGEAMEIVYDVGLKPDPFDVNQIRFYRASKTICNA